MFLQVSGGAAQSGSWNVSSPGEMAAFGFTMTGFGGGRRDDNSESGFLVEFIQNGDVVDEEYVELEASFADRFHGFVTGGTFDTVRVSVMGATTSDSMTFVWASLKSPPLVFLL